MPDVTDLDRERVLAFEDEQIRRRGAELAAEARQRQHERERVCREAAEEVRWSVDVAREALGRDAVPVAVAMLASAVLQRRYLQT